MSLVRVAASDPESQGRVGGEESFREEATQELRLER